jgi:acyl carrier protein
MLPAGYPAQDVEVLLLDESGTVIEGEGVGEIVVKGRHLSRGYWGKAELTNQRFLPDPGGRGMRYHTGDLGYRSPDGCITHRGRKDSQIKVRGYRVEVAEIELALLSISGIKEAVVVAQEGHGEKQLVAYVVPIVPSPSTRSILELLRQKLPDFMVPSAVVILGALPLLPNGKVDRQGLLSADWGQAELERAHVTPSNPVEEKLSEIWTNVLGLERVSTQDDFFELGGHSLSATRVLSQVTSSFALQLPLRTFFDNPTIKKMALVIARILTERADHKNLTNPLEEMEGLSSRRVPQNSDIKTQ